MIQSNTMLIFQLDNLQLNVFQLVFQYRLINPRICKRNDRNRQGGYWALTLHLLGPVWNTYLTNLRDIQGFHTASVKDPWNERYRKWSERLRQGWWSHWLLQSTKVRLNLVRDMRRELEQRWSPEEKRRLLRIQWALLYALGLSM